jgi:hypothetical protein
MRRELANDDGPIFSTVAKLVDTPAHREVPYSLPESRELEPQGKALGRWPRTASRD